MLRDSSNALIFLATVAGAYFGAAALSVEWAFWLILPAAILIAIARRALPATKRWFHRYREFKRKGRQYDSLLQTAGERQVRIEELEGELAVVQSRSDVEYLKGAADGRRRAVSEMLAAATATQLKPVALTVSGGDGAVSITAEYLGDVPKVHGRWFARVRGMPRFGAALAVTSVDEDRSMVVLDIEYVADERFASMLERSAASSSDFPTSVEVDRRSFVVVEELLEEAEEL